MAKTAKKSLKAKSLSRRRRGGRRRGGRGRRGGGMHYVETIPVSVELGTTVDLTYSLLKNRPGSSNFRVQYVHFVGTCGYEMSTVPKPGYFAPSCVQLDILNSVSTGEIVASSGPVVMGVQPRNVKIHQPRSSDWLPYSQDGKESFCKISAVCLGKPGVDKGFVRGIIHVLVRFGVELVSATCPNLQDFINQNLVSSSSMGSQIPTLDSMALE